MNNSKPPISDKKTYIPPEILERMQLGREKKLWAVEVVYLLKNETKIQIKRNMTSEELMKFREALFRYGMQIPVEEHHWKVIPPYDIHEVDIYQQSSYVMGDPYKSM